MLNNGHCAIRRQGSKSSTVVRLIRPTHGACVRDDGATGGFSRLRASRKTSLKSAWGQRVASGGGPHRAQAEVKRWTNLHPLMGTRGRIRHSNCASSFRITRPPASRDLWTCVAIRWVHQGQSRPDHLSSHSAALPRLHSNWSRFARGHYCLPAHWAEHRRA
jgi:hypothetical protein